MEAINQTTNQLVSPEFSSKEDSYICPECKQDVILCKGQIKKPYFRHKVITNCIRFAATVPESQQHKFGKKCLKKLLSNNKVTIKRTCPCCKKKKSHEFDFTKYDISNEVRFEHNGSYFYADCAVMLGGNIKYIFEVCHTHRTKTRPEPWFEIDAAEIIEKFGTKDNVLKCIRDKKCESCKYFDNLKQNNLSKYVRIKLGQDFNNPIYNNNGRPIHKRFDMSYLDDEVYDNNKKICEIFNKDLKVVRMIVYVYKGSIIGYLVLKTDYYKYNYWNNDIRYDGVNQELSLPYVFIKEYNGSGTVKIITDLIKNARNLNLTYI